MTDKYRANPDFAVPDATGAQFFAYFTLDEYTKAKADEIFDGWWRDGVRHMRLTVVNDEFPNDPYPHGYWLEGWTDEQVRQLPFGEARPDDGTVSPPLVALDGPLKGSLA